MRVTVLAKMCRRRGKPNRGVAGPARGSRVSLRCVTKRSARTGHLDHHLALTRFWIGRQVRLAKAKVLTVERRVHSQPAASMGKKREYWCTVPAPPSSSWISPYSTTKPSCQRSSFLGPVACGEGCLDPPPHQILAVGVRLVRIPCLAAARYGRLIFRRHTHTTCGAKQRVTHLVLPKAASSSSSWRARGRSGTLGDARGRSGTLGMARGRWGRWGR